MFAGKPYQTINRLSIYERIRFKITDFATRNFTITTFNNPGVSIELQFDVLQCVHHIRLGLKYLQSCKENHKKNSSTAGIVTVCT